MRPNKPAVAVAAAAALMALAACGGGSGSETSAGVPETAAEGGNAGAETDPEASAPAPAPEGADQAQDGGTITVDTAVAPSTLDPTRAYYTDSTAILSDLVTRSLTQYVWRAGDGGNGDMVLVPDMATDLGRPNADNTEWTFTLREGLKYEDGTPVKAEDVAYAIKRSFAIEELPEGPTYQTTFFLDGDTYKGPFKKQSELKEGETSGDDYAGVEVDGQDIIIKMRRPFVDMSYYASFPAFTGIPESADKNPTEYGNHPLATGPYKFDTYKAGSSLTLVRNDQWDPATDPGRHQYADAWDFNFAQNQDKFEGTLVNDTGTAQTSLSYNDVTAPTFKKLTDQGDADRIVRGTSPCTYMWYIDMRKITDKDVRMALGYAYPYEAAWKASGEIVGVTRIGGTTILPPGTNGRVEYDVLGNEGTTPDPEQAQQLLQQAGEEGYEIKFLFSTDDPLSVASKNEAVKSLEASGFKATPIASTAATIRDDLSDPKSPINIRSQGWCSDWPSGGSWFPAQWDGDLVGQEGIPNPSFLNEPDVDKQIDDILDNSTAEEATARWGELDKYIMEKHYPAVITGYTGSALPRGSRIGGMENDSVRGMPTFNQMYIIEE